MSEDYGIVPALVGLMKGIGNPPGIGDIVGRKLVDGVIVSTVCTPDLGYETALMDDDDTIPVERYETEAEAVAGHQRWIDAAPYGEVTKLGYMGVIEAEKHLIKNAEGRTMEGDMFGEINPEEQQ